MGKCRTLNTHQNICATFSNFLLENLSQRFDEMKDIKRNREILEVLQIMENLLILECSIPCGLKKIKV